MPNKVFISYRREDSRYQARRVYDAFVHALPPDTVFMDVDSIPPGADFVEILEGWVQQCDVLLALIGPSWLSSIDPRTNLRRLDNPEDFVRIEIRGALERKIPVVPVLLDATEMPTAADLPDDIMALRRRHAEFVDFRTFDADVQRLIKRLKIGKEIERRREAPEPQAEGIGNVIAAVPGIGALLEQIKPDAVAAKPLLLAATAALLAAGAVYFAMSNWQPVDPSAGMADFAKSEEGRRTAEARAKEATDALAVAEKARQEAEATVAAAAATQAKSEEARRTAETRAGEAADALAKTEKARQDAEARATSAAAAQAKAEESQRTAEKARAAAEGAASGAAIARVQAANDAAEALKKSDKARLDAEARATSAAAAQAKAEEGLRTAEKARAAAETIANAAASAKAKADNDRIYAEARANNTAEALRKSEEARKEAEAKLAALSRPAAQQTAGSPSLSSGHLLNSIGSRSRWAKWSDLYCNEKNNANFLSLEVGNDSITWINGVGKMETEKILFSFENEFHTNASFSQQTVIYSRDSNSAPAKLNRLVVQPSDRDNFYLERCP
jgi:TIR domain